MASKLKSLYNQHYVSPQEIEAQRERERIQIFYRSCNAYINNSDELFIRAFKHGISFIEFRACEEKMCKCIEEKAKEKYGSDVTTEYHPYESEQYCEYGICETESFPAFVRVHFKQ